MNLNIKNIPKNDKKTWDLICSGNVKGCFQIESPLGRSFCKKVLPRSIRELSDLIAIVRPGTLDVIVDGKSMTQHYIDRKNGVEEITYFHASVSDILDKTLGILIYQEDSLRIAKKLAGFSLSESEELRKCVAEDSIIMTSGGPRYIQDICKNFKNKRFNFKILSCDEKGKLIFEKITDVWEVGEKEVLKVKTRNGYYLEATEDHKVFTQDGWKTIGSLTDEDFLAVPKNYKYKGHTKNLSDSLAFLVGIFVGEGCYTEKSTSPKITNSDPWVLEKVRNAVDENFGPDNYRESTHPSGCHDIRFTKKAGIWFKDKFDKLKSRDKIIPNFILSAPVEASQAFIGAIFTGEGTVNVDRSNIEISSTSIDIIRNLQLLLLRDNIPSCISTHNGFYKEEPYISYRLYIHGNYLINVFSTKYEKFICPTKLELLKLVKEPKWANPQFLVPKCFIGAATKNVNLSCVLGNPLNDEVATSTVYNSNLTYEKVTRINQILNSELLDNILNYDYKFVKVKSISNAGIKKVYDFTVSSERPYGFINGILTHNCIGKKRVDLMALMESKFLEGCKKVGLVTEKEAKEIFEIIRASQRYQFNLSHSISYALTTYLTAYIKAHHPKEFFTSWLYYASEKIDPKLEIEELVSDAKSFDIDIQPPTILSIEDGGFHLTKDNKTAFGIVEIKGIGKSHIKKLIKKIESIHTPINKMSWFQVLSQLLEGQSSNVATNLIKVGCLSFLPISRKKMIYEFNIWRKLKEEEKAVSIERGATDLKSALTAISDSVKNARRQETIRDLILILENPPYSLEDNFLEIIENEESLLGVPLTLTRLDGKDLMPTVSCKDFLGGRGDKKNILAVEIKQVKEYITKRGPTKGDKMAFLTIEDHSSRMDAVIFAEPYAKYQEILQPKAVVYLIGDRDKKGSFNVSKVVSI